MIAMEGTYYTVRSLSILTTVLQRSDGRLLYAPNAVLSKKLIDNVRRSGRMSESILFKVDINTTQEQLDLLRDKMLDFLVSEGRDYTSKFAVIIKEILLSEQAMRCQVNLEHKYNWQEMAKRNARRNRFMFRLREAMLELKMTCPATGAIEKND
jgi:small-conductance mechanosensitive channel